MAEVKRLIGQRSFKKGQITQDFKALESLEEKDFSFHLLDQYISSIEKNLEIIEGFDEKICLDRSETDIESILVSSRKYYMDVSLRLCSYKAKRDHLKVVCLPKPDGDATKAVKLPLPPILLQTFQNNVINPFAYYNFKKSFSNAVAGMPNLTNSQKLIYLKGYLAGEALNLVENLPVEDNSFRLAVDLLDHNFLDKDLIIDKTLNSILMAPEVSQLKEVETFVRLISNKVQDLKGVGVNLTETGSSGLLLLSKIINLKLPRQFLIELSRETNTNYPNFNQLVDKFQEILIRLKLGYAEQSVKHKVKIEAGSVSSPPKWDLKNKQVDSKSKEYKVKSGQEISKKQSYRCKFCPSTDHSSSKCSSYAMLESRKARASSLGICSRCLNQKHNTSDCPGLKAALPYRCYVCGKSEHHGALCPQAKEFSKQDKMFNINTVSDIICPIVSLPVSRGKTRARCNFLLDSGAQFSIINKEFVERKVGPCLSPPISRLVSSFGLPAAEKKGFNYTAYLRLPCGMNTYCIFFAIEGFSLSVEIPKLTNVIQSMNDHEYFVSPDFPKVKGDDIEIFGIIGNDILQCFDQYSLERAFIYNKQSCKVIKLANGYIPYGTGLNYMPPNEEADYILRVKDGPPKKVLPNSFENKVKCDSYKTNVEVFESVDVNNSKQTDVKFNEDLYNGDTLVFHNSFLKDSVRPKVEKRGDVSVSSLKGLRNFTPPKRLGKANYLVNFALEPKGHQFDPLQEIFANSSVEYGLDNFYSLESVGIKEDVSIYESDQVESFKKSISYKHGHYYVKLPWNSDFVKQVPSNLKIALAVAQRVYEKLENKGIADKYEEVFDEQEALGIIEPVEKRAPGQIFIPHRPVIKTDDQTTTKIRPVFNCSLKVGKAPSLNEAAFPGIDLMNNLLSLLLYFRTNNYVVLADIMKAFLQIRLSHEEDKDRFCFFRKIKGKFLPYRYNTIIFGFVSSPFILNYIVQHHLTLNSHLEIASSIRDKFYVDNLIYTSNKSDELSRDVDRIHNIMLSGGLPLREWACNDMSVLSSLKQDEICNKEEVKVLGYLYNRDYDSVRLKNASLDQNASTKRQILSSLASVFDPLGLFAPVLLQGKLLIREMCQKMVDWDQELDKELLARWVFLCKNFQEIGHASFNRRTFNTNFPVKLFVFADASKEAYGCSIYAIQHRKSSLLFSKVKVSPLKQRTLPTLELLAAQLSLKCLKTIFEGGLVPSDLLDSVVLFVDSQVVLAWILGNKAPKKNIFVNNRLKEISKLLDDIKCKYGQVSFT